MRRQKVFALLVKARIPRALLPADKLRFNLLRERHVELEMPVPRYLTLASLVHPVMRVLAHRFQHRVARRAHLDAVGRDERLVDQTRKRVQNSIFVQLLTGNAHGAAKGPATDKYREPPQELLFVTSKVVVAPLDRGQQCLSTRQGGLASSSQQPEPIVEPDAYFFHRKHLHPSGGHLDSQRNTVHPPAVSAPGAPRFF